MVVYGILIIVSIVTGVLSANIFLPNLEEQVIYITNDEANIQFELYGNYIENEIGEYDLYATNYDKGINVGAFIYDENDQLTKKEIYDSRIDWIHNSRNNVKLIDSYEEILEDKEIISEAYYGEKDNEAFAYVLSFIEFKESEDIVEVIQVCFNEDYNELKEELKEIIQSITYINK